MRLVETQEHNMETVKIEDIRKGTNNIKHLNVDGQVFTAI